MYLEGCSETEGEFRQPLALYPKLAEAYYNLGLAVAAHKKFPEGIRLMHTSLRLNPYHASTYWNLGRTLKDSGNTLENYRLAWEIDKSQSELAVDY